MFIVPATWALTACGGPLLVPPPPSASISSAVPAVVSAGPIELSGVEATIAMVSSAHRLLLDSRLGPLIIAVGSGCDAALARGTPVQLVTAVQHVTVAPSAPETPSFPRLSAGETPAMYSTTIGRVEAHAPEGRIVVSTPGGLIEVPAPRGHWPVGTTVQVWTSVQSPVGCRVSGAFS